MNDKEMLYVHTMEYYSALRKKTILAIPTNMDKPFIDIMLSKISQSSKDKCCMMPLI